MVPLVGIYGQRSQGVGSFPSRNGPTFDPCIISGMRQKRIYIAGPLFSDQDRQMLSWIAKALELEGYQVFLPHRDSGDVREDAKEQSRREIFNKNNYLIAESDAVVALLDGPDVDSGTAGEMGEAFTRGIPIFGYSTDLKRRGHPLNIMIWGFCAFGSRVHDSLPLLVKAIWLAFMEPVRFMERDAT